MSYITEIFERLDLQQVREFLLNGVECVQVDGNTYRQRLEESGNPVFEMIEAKFPDKEENDKVAGYIHDYARITQNVYMEIGLQCGAVLAVKLLANPQKE